MPARSPELEAMIAAARKAADGLMQDFARLASLEVTEKAPSDFVSTADMRSQAVLRRELHRACPDHSFLVEEADGLPPGSAAQRFVVDPLDGTINFLHGIAHFAVSIAREVQGKVVSGVVLNVPAGELFWAEKGTGAWCGERPIRVSGERELSRSVVGTGIPHRSGRHHEQYLAALNAVMKEVAGIRRMGSAALDLAYVAAGRFEAFFELGLAPWDVAAGTLLVREAGGIVTRTNGGPMIIEDRDVLAACDQVMHRGLVGRLAPLHGLRVTDAT